LKDLVQFWTAWPALPMLKDKMVIGFLPSDSKNHLATTDTCFNKLMIPTVHNEYAEFMKCMDISVSNGKLAFGKM
jgi:hypothetical protein